MRSLWILGLGLLCSIFLVAAAGAAVFPVSGSLSVAIATVPPSNIVGAGTGTSNGFGSQVTIPKSLFFTTSSRAVLPQTRTGTADIPTTMDMDFMGTGALVPLNKVGAGGLNNAGTLAITQFGRNANAATATVFAAGKIAGKSGSCNPPDFLNCLTLYAANPIVQIVLTNVGNSFFDADNGDLSAVQTGTYYGVAIAGGGVNGLSAVQGTSLVGLFNTNAAFPQYPPTPQANLPVPLNVAGNGFGYAIVLGAVNLTLTGAGWTTGTAAVVATPGTTTTGGAAMNPAFLTETAMGAEVLVTRIKQTGFDNRTAMGLGSVQLVTPVSVKTNIGGFEQLPVFAFLTLTYTPEPGTLLLVGSGLAGLAAVNRRRKS